MIGVPSQRRRWLSLGALVISLFMVMLDDTVVAVALPSIQRDLGVGLSELEWIVNAYVVSFAACMLLGGKLADLVGRRQIFLLGLAAFTLGSLGAGLAPAAGWLIGARVGQGVAAALMVPGMLAIISETFPPQERGLAIGVWSGVSALGLAVGPLLGGVLTEQVDWSWIFFINVPIGILGYVAARILVPESRDTSPNQRLDVPGLLTSTLALFALTFALIEANTYGWGAARILAAFAAAAVGLAAFVMTESMRAAPMLDLSLFRGRAFAGANAVSLLVNLSMFGVLFFLSLYLQQILGYTAVRAGTAFLPLMGMLILIGPVAGKASDRTGPRWLMVSGLLFTALALFLLSRLGEGSSFLDLLPGLLLAGLGIALALAPMYAAALGAVPEAKAGVASASLSAAGQIGGALGIAVLGAVLTAGTRHSLARGATQAQAFVDGFSSALLIAALIAVAGSLIAALIMPTTETKPMPDAFRPAPSPPHARPAWSSLQAATRHACGSHACR